MENGNQSSSSRPLLHRGLLVLAVVSLVLQIIGLATPGWIVMYVKSQRISIDVSVGLWLVNYCLNGVCGTKTIKEFFGGFSVYSNVMDTHLDEYRAETIIGVVCMLMFCVCLLYQIYRKGSSGQSMWIKIYCVFSLVSAILALIASGKFGRQLAKSNTRLGRYSPYLVPYSVILTGVGGILAAILFMIGVIQTVTRNDMSNQQQTVTIGNFPVQGGPPHAVNQQIAGYPQNMNTQSLPPPYESIAHSQGSQYPINYLNVGMENPSVIHHSDRPSHSVSDYRESGKQPSREYHVQASYGRKY